MRRLRNILIWAVISLLAGALGSYFLNLDFLWAVLIAAAALIINGLVAEWEDSKNSGQ